MKLVVSPKLKEDFESYYLYYKKINHTLAVKFKNELKQAKIDIKAIKFFEIRYKNIRCYPLNKFPFMIHFVVEENTIYLLALIHTSRNPTETWINY